MSNKSSKDKGQGTRLPADFDLWYQVAATVQPLRPDERVGPPSADPGPKAAERPGAVVKQARQEHLNSTAQPPDRRAVQAKPPPSAPRPKSSAMTGLDRRDSQKLVRGNVQIDARLDLHGMTQASAHIALRSFIARSRLAGDRTVLVITGKGGAPLARHTLHGYNHVDMPEHEGILRRVVPRWLQEPELREHVTGYQPAHPRHGGGGALYVRLRRLDRR